MFVFLVFLYLLPRLREHCCSDPNRSSGGMFTSTAACLCCVRHVHRHCLPVLADGGAALELTRDLWNSHCFIGVALPLPANGTRLGRGSNTC